MKTKIYAKVNHVEGLHFTGENKAGMKLHMASNSAGVAEGPSPMELVLQAAGGCTSMDVVFILKKRKIIPSQFELEMEGIKREEHPRVYESIDLTFRGKGEGLTVAEMDRAVALSLKSYCSVFGMLKSSAEINWRCELID